MGSACWTDGEIRITSSRREGEDGEEKKGAIVR